MNRLPANIPLRAVTNQQLTAAIAGTARNPATPGLCPSLFSDPPTQSEMRAYRDWGNALFNALAR